MVPQQLRDTAVGRVIERSVRIAAENADRVARVGSNDQAAVTFEDLVAQRWQDFREYVPDIPRVGDDRHNSVRVQIEHAGERVGLVALASGAHHRVFRRR